MADQFFSLLANEEAMANGMRDRDTSAADAIYSELFDEQKAVIDDTYDFKSLLTPRRSGKTHCAIAYSVIQCLRKPGSVVIIVTLTLKSAKRLYWGPILEFSDRFGLNLRRQGGVHHTNAEARFENGSNLYLMGAETKSEIEKLRGLSCDLFIIDECKSFSEVIFEELVDDILSPALQDRGGTLFILGTPGNILSGPFYRATYPLYKDPETQNPVSRAYSNPAKHWSKKMYIPEWSRHTWTQKENTKTVNNLWDSSLRKKKMKRWSDDNPTWLREHLGQWISMGDSMVYAYNTLVRLDIEDEMTRCVYRSHSGAGYTHCGLPDGHNWRYVLGMDLGYEDDLAIVVAAYAEDLDTMYMVHEFKKPHMIISEVAAEIDHIMAMFGGEIEAMVADTGAGGKTIVESLNSMYGTFFVKADKKDKLDFIELLNSDLYDGKLKVLEDSELAHEWLNLQWNLKDKNKKEMARANRLKEDSSCANHLSDATLYTWRFCLHHFSRERSKEVEAGSEEFHDNMDMEEAMESVARREKALAEDFEFNNGEDNFSGDGEWIL